MPDDILGWKGSNMDKNAIWRTYNWLKILEISTIKKTISGLLPVQLMSPQCVCIIELQRKSVCMSFLMELSLWLNHNAACKKLQM